MGAVTKCLEEQQEFLFTTTDPVDDLPPPLAPRKFSTPTASPSWRSSAHRYAPSQRVEVVPIPRRNIGVRVQRAIRARDVIFIEYPLVSVRCHHTNDTDSAEQALFAALHALPPARLAAFWELYNKHGLWSYHPRPETRAQGIWDSNVVRANESGEGYCFATASRVNHDCWPNAELELRFDGHGRAYARVVALSDIPCTGEVTFCYSGRRGHVEKDVLERRRELMRDWGFWCQCPRCRFESAALSIGRRKRSV